MSPHVGGRRCVFRLDHGTIRTILKYCKLPTMNGGGDISRNGTATKVRQLSSTRRMRKRAGRRRISLRPEHKQRRG